VLFKTTYNGFKTVWQGLILTVRHMFGPNSRRKVLPVKADNYFTQLEKGTNTIQYPKQAIPVPEVGRYQLDVVIDDCIVCDLCAKVCPVDCIDIESIKATEAIGQTSDGSTKRLYAAKFDIDMAKCMFCGLCTVVCPTECITMTNQYDKNYRSLADLTYQFSDMTPGEVEAKKQEAEKQLAERAAAKKAALRQQEGKV